MRPCNFWEKQICSRSGLNLQLPFNDLLQNVHVNLLITIGAILRWGDLISELVKLGNIFLAFLGYKTRQFTNPQLGTKQLKLQ